MCLPSLIFARYNIRTISILQLFMAAFSMLQVSVITGTSTLPVQFVTWTTFVYVHSHPLPLHTIWYLMQQNSAYSVLSYFRVSSKLPFSMVKNSSLVTQLNTSGTSFDQISQIICANYSFCRWRTETRCFIALISSWLLSILLASLARSFSNLST